jgi:hypothetical protein
MADLTGYTLLKNTTKKTCQMNALYSVDSIKRTVLLKVLLINKTSKNLY